VERAAQARRDGLPALGLAIAVAAALYVLFGRLNLDPLDEGFLWYGVLWTRAGEVPLRDFQAYEPGRYYWCVAGSFLFGQGILALRLSLAIAQACGLFLGLLVCRRATGSVVALAACALILGAWMFPRHKPFEASIAMAAVWVGVRLLEKPSTRRVLAAGAFTGFVAWFGRNHGLYCGLAFASMIAVLLRAGRIPSFRHAGGAFVGGMMLGSVPLWGMLLVVPGFAAAFLQSITFNLTQAVNLPLPYPWPWRIDLRGLHGFDVLAGIGTAAAFAMPLVIYPVGLALALRTTPERLADRAPVIAAAFVGLFYLHHVSVRSDAWHLAQVIHPLLILSIAIPACLTSRAAAQRSVFVLLGVITAFATLNTNPTLAHLGPGRRVDFVPHDVAGDRLQLPSVQAAQLTEIETAVRSQVPPDGTLFVAPTRPGFYPIFGRKSPDWWLYFVWPASIAAQRATIEHLEAANVNWALIVDEAIDGREDLRFQNSNPLVWDYLTRSFVDVDGTRLPPAYRLLRRRTR
jgi:hypothetical protein